MVVEASISAIGYFAPIFAFLLVFIVVYALLIKTAVMGNKPAVLLFISFLFSVFFVLETSLVNFVNFISAWFGVILIGVFFLIVVLAFIPGIDLAKFFGGGGNNWFAWTLLGLTVIFFVVSSAYVFNWIFNWEMIRERFGTKWFGAILLLIIAAIVSWKISR